MRSRSAADETDVQDVLDDFDRDQARTKRFAPKEAGESRIRILPPRAKGKFFRKFGMHYNLDLLSPGFTDQHRSAACLDLTLGEDCPVDKVVARLYYDARNPDGSRKEALHNRAGEVRRRKRFVCLVIDVDKPSRGVLPWEYGPTVHEMIVPIFREFGDITHPTTGRDLRVKFEKKGDYVTCTSITPTGRETKIDYAGWQDERIDLETYTTATMIPADKLQAMLEDKYDSSKKAETSSDDDIPDSGGEESEENDEDELLGDSEESDDSSTEDTETESETEEDKEEVSTDDDFGMPDLDATTREQIRKNPALKKIYQDLKKKQDAAKQSGKRAATKRTASK